MSFIFSLRNSSLVQIANAAGSSCLNSRNNIPCCLKSVQLQALQSCSRAQSYGMATQFLGLGRGNMADRKVNHIWGSFSLLGSQEWTRRGRPPFFFWLTLIPWELPLLQRNHHSNEERWTLNWYCFLMNAFVSPGGSRVPDNRLP